MPADTSSRSFLKYAHKMSYYPKGWGGRWRERGGQENGSLSCCQLALAGTVLSQQQLHLLPPLWQPASSCLQRHPCYTAQKTIVITDVYNKLYMQYTMLISIKIVPPIYILHFILFQLTLHFLPVHVTWASCVCCKVNAVAVQIKTETAWAGTSHPVCRPVALPLCHISRTEI